MSDFKVHKFYAYKGPSYYLDRPALVFNLYLDPDGCRVGFYRDAVVAAFPTFDQDYPTSVVDLFCRLLVEVLKCDIDLFVGRCAVTRDGDEYVVAVEYLDEAIAEDAVYLVRDWLSALNRGAGFDFAGGFATLKAAFDKTLYGGPTLYSLVEGAVKRGIPVFYLFEENEFQWGYGRKQVRGRSTTVSVDSIKDTEFTMYKDMVKDFLLMCGFPTPVGRNCFTEEEILAAAERLGFPVVVKPVAGHKGQGVVTGIDAPEGVRAAFQAILQAAQAEGKAFEGAIVEQQVYGTDHRLLAVKGRFVAALERVPAYVDGNGRDSIAHLIEVANATPERADTARSPLCKIKPDTDLQAFLALQGKSLESVPFEGERVFLRRVANISAGGVSINVTDRIHPRNVKMVEDIAAYFGVTCLGIDVLAKDIGKPWDEGDFGIIEINAGPGVFMHLAPALGGSIDVPGKILEAHFPSGQGRIPILMGNRLGLGFCTLLTAELKARKPDIFVGCLNEVGVFFDGEYFFKNEDHNQNVKIILRRPQVDFAAFMHTTDDLLDAGTFHQGADVVVLDHPSDTEEVLARDLLPGGWLVRVDDASVRLLQGDAELRTIALDAPEARDAALLEILRPCLDELLTRYE